MPRHTFAATFGAVIAQGGDYRETRAQAGQPEHFDEEGLYADVRAT